MEGIILSKTHHHKAKQPLCLLGEGLDKIYHICFHIFCEVTFMAKMTFSETDNQKEVYNIAKLLMDIVPITSNERIPVFCSHPFTDFIYTPQINNNKIDKTWNLTNPEDFEEWRTAILQRLEQSEIRSMFYITSKAYRLTFLKYAQPYLTKQTFSELFGDIWVTSENPNDDVNVSLRELVNWFRNTDKNFLWMKRIMLHGRLYRKRWSCIEG